MSNNKNKLIHNVTRTALTQGARNGGQQRFCGLNDSGRISRGGSSEAFSQGNDHKFDEFML